MTIIIILIVLFILFGGFGYWGRTRYGNGGWSPLGILLVIVLLLWLTGNLHLNLN